MKFIAGKMHFLSLPMLMIIVNVILQVKCERIIKVSDAYGIRQKRGAAYAGPHPGGGYGQGGVGIPGLNSAIQYSAYSTLLNSGHSSGYGGGSSHGRKLTVDQAIGMFGHHTLNRPYPYTLSHGSGGGSSGNSGRGSGSSGHRGGGGGGGHGGSSGGGRGGGGGGGAYGR